MQIRKDIESAKLRAIKNDVKKEIWTGKGTYKNFQRDHVSSLDSQPKISRSSANQILPKNFSKWSPELRTEYVRKHLGDNIREYVEDRLGEYNIGNAPDVERNSSRKKKKKKTRPKRDNNHPVVSPLPETDKNPSKPPIIPPRPRPEVSETPPKIRETKKKWKSRIGYFVTLSDIRVHTDTVVTDTDPTKDFSFESMPDRYLKLEAGDTWESDWIDSGVIRGLDVNVLGTHKINYVKNGDFEI